MAYTARTLITKGWYLSNIVSRQLQSVDEDQIYEGLDMLNELLSLKSVDQGLIPYFREGSFTGVIGQETYSIDSLVEIESLTFNIGAVRYSMLYQDRTTYFGSSRVDNINSLPYQYHLERKLNGSNLYIYFRPADTYTFKIWGKYALDEVETLETDLSLTYETNYLAYLRYALADYMCQEYSVGLTPQAGQQLRSLERMIRDLSPLDLRQKSFSPFKGQADLNYGIVNISGGWTTPS